jgi:hypothetical protein
MRLIEIGGQNRPVLFTINALSEFEQLAGVSVFDSERVQTALVSVFGFRALVYAGLKYGAIASGTKFKHSLEQVGDWLDFTGAMQTAVMDAFAHDMASVFPVAHEEGGATAGAEKN